MLFKLIDFNITFIPGQIFTALKAPEKALAAYKTCYQLDTAQKDILETICNLLIELPVDAGKSRWVCIIFAVGVADPFHIYTDPDPFRGKTEPDSN